MLITVGDKQYEAVVNGFTPIAFSSTFRVAKKNGEWREKDISEDISLIVDADSIPPILPLLECFYAFVKSANPAFKTSFKEFVESFPAEAYDLTAEGGWSEAVAELIKENFFRKFSKEADVGAEAAEAPEPASSGVSKGSKNG